MLSDAWNEIWACAAELVLAMLERCEPERLVSEYCRLPGAAAFVRDDPSRSNRVFLRGSPGSGGVTGAASPAPK